MLRPTATTGTTADVQGEQLSLELAIWAAVLVLAYRLTVLMRVTREIPSLHQELLETLRKGDIARLRLKIRNLGYRNPYAEVALELLHADDDPNLSELRKTEARLLRMTQHKQALDALSLVVVVCVFLFSRSDVPYGLGLSMAGGAACALLLSTVLVRALLAGQMKKSLESLRAALDQRPKSAPSRDDFCRFCGHAVETVEVGLKVSDREAQVDALHCQSCEKVVLRAPSSLFD